MSLGGKFVGDLHYDKTKHTPVLIIGHHILHGKVVDCERPFVAIEKKRSLATDEGTCTYSCDTSFLEQAEPEYRKLPLFTNYNE